jgi:hypothetical protein
MLDKKISKKQNLYKLKIIGYLFVLALGQWLRVALLCTYYESSIYIYIKIRPVHISWNYGFISSQNVLLRCVN